MGSSSPLAGGPGDRPAYDALDVMRAIAALAVVSGHARGLLISDWSTANSKWFAPVYASTRWGHQAVVVFFVISGFWIAKVVWARRDSWTWTSYLTDRLTRLWMVLLPALLLGAGLDWIGRSFLGLPLYFGAVRTTVIAGDIGQSLSLSTLACNAVFLQTVACPTFGSNGALWSLCNEFWYYLWFPCLLLASRGRIWLGLAAVVSMCVCWRVLPLFPCWLLGVAAYAAHETMLSRTPWSARWPIRTLALAGLAAALLVSGTLNSLVGDYLAAVSAAICVVVILSGKGYRAGRLLSPFAAYGRNCSFSLYAVHLPLLTLAAGLVDRKARLSPSPLAMICLLGFVLGAVAAGGLFAQVTERHTAVVKRAVSKWLIEFPIGPRRAAIKARDATG